MCYNKNMIGSINGKLLLKTPKFIIVDVSGVGYKISISVETFSKIEEVGKNVFVWTHMHIREDAQDLYGFSDRQELEFFEMLINVSGIGPKGALGILGIASIDTLKKAISTNDTSYLTKVSGIGRKTAEKIVIELRDKFGKEQSDGSLEKELDVLEALKSLGYSQNESREALKKVSPDGDLNKKIKEALKILSVK